MMSEPPNRDFTEFDTFLANTMAGVLTVMDAALKPSRRLASLGRRTRQESRPQ